MQPTEMQTRLESEVLEVEWDALRPHVARDAVVLVGPELPLIKVAMAFGLDLQADVAAWMKDGGVAKVESVDAFGVDEKFRFVIVQPFVLVQRVEP